MSISQNFPNTRPSLNLNFARSKTLDPRITFTRTFTGTYVDESGVIRNAVADEPRFDHDPVTGECLGLLVEESRSNLITYSEQFDNAAWGTSPVYTVGIDSTTAPDGTTSAEKLIRDTTNTQAQIYRNITGISTDTKFTLSCFCKSAEWSKIGLREGVATGYWETFDLSVGEKIDNGSGTTSTITPYPNEWYRISMTLTTTETQTSYGVRIIPLPDSYTSGTPYVNQSGNDVDGLYLWGAQLEEGAFPTSYIPNGTDSQATRNPDNVSMTGDNFSDWYNQSEGSILWRGTIHSIPISGSRIFEIYNSSTPAERMAISVENNELMYMRVRKTNDTATQTYNLGTVSLGSEYKIGLGVDGSSLCLAVNDEIKTTINDSFALSPADRLILTDLKDLGENRKFTTRHTGLSYYPVRLPNATLQTLTK